MCNLATIESAVRLLDYYHTDTQAGSRVCVVLADGDARASACGMHPPTSRSVTLSRGCTLRSRDCRADNGSTLAGECDVTPYEGSCEMTQLSGFRAAFFVFNGIF